MAFAVAAKKHMRRNACRTVMADDGDRLTSCAEEWLSFRGRSRIFANSPLNVRPPGSVENDTLKG